MTKKAKKYSTKSFKGIFNPIKAKKCKEIEQDYESYKYRCNLLSNPYNASNNIPKSEQDLTTSICRKAGELQKKLREKGCKR